jgi:hypothetical protein
MIWADAELRGRTGKSLGIVSQKGVYRSDIRTDVICHRNSPRKGQRYYSEHQTGRYRKRPIHPLWGGRAAGCHGVASAPGTN